MANSILTAKEIADAIEVNCLEHLTGEKDFLEWDDEQHRLWELAKAQGLERVVARLCAPALAVGLDA